MHPRARCSPKGAHVAIVRSAARVEEGAVEVDGDHFEAVVFGHDGTTREDLARLVSLLHSR